jgi:hypothetical protein
MILPSMILPIPRRLRKAGGMPVQGTAREGNENSLADSATSAIEEADDDSPAPLHRMGGESDATLAHRMGEGLGVRASGEVRNFDANFTNCHE